MSFTACGLSFWRVLSSLCNVMGLCGSSQSIEEKVALINASPFFIYLPALELQQFVSYFQITRILNGTTLYSEVLHDCCIVVALWCLYTHNTALCYI